MKRPTLIRCCCAALFAVTIVGCKESNNNANASASADAAKQEMKKQVNEAVDATADYAAKQKQEFERKLSAQIEDISTRIDTLQDKIDKLGEDTKAEMKDTLDTLKIQRDQVATKLKKLRDSSPDAWGEMKTGITAAMEDLEKAYSKAKEEFDDA